MRIEEIAWRAEAVQILPYFYFHLSVFSEGKQKAESRMHSALLID